MAKSPYLEQSKLLALLNSPFVVQVFRFFVIRWFLDIIVSLISRRYKAKVLPLSTESRLESTLDMIVRDVVKDLGYVGAMVATLEADNSLPVRAYYVDSDVITQEEIEIWERRISRVVFRKVGLKAPIARAFLDKKQFRKNLSVRAIMAEGGPRIITHHELFSLFTPVVPWFLRGVIRRIQKNKLGVSQVAAVPFFLEDKSKDRANVVGNLFVLSRSEISEDAKRRLEAFGRMAAIAIENENRLQKENRLNRQIQALQSTTLRIQTSLQDEQAILDDIVEGVVMNLGYVGAMVATREDNTLPVKASFVDPDVINDQDIEKWERMISFVVGTDIGLQAPIARTYLHDDRFKDNLSFRAVNAAEGPQVVPDDELFSLFVPVVPESLRQVIWRIQKIFGINQVIAVPFFFEEEEGSSAEVIGNLFVSSRETSFSQEEIEILKTFAQQAAIGIRNAQLYHKVQELQQNISVAYEKEIRQREAANRMTQIAEKFGQIRHNLHSELVKLQIYADEALEENTELLPDLVTEKLSKITEIADIALDLVKNLPNKDVTSNLAKSFDETLIEEEKRDVREYVNEAIDKSRLSQAQKIDIALDLLDESIIIHSKGDLAEVFKILLDNAVDAIGESSGKVVISNQIDSDKWVVISVSDTGPGVPPEYREKIFGEFTTKTKKSKGAGGLGYGLFHARTVLGRMNGQISLAEDNDNGSGATFLVKLPIINSD